MFDEEKNEEYQIVGSCRASIIFAFRKHENIQSTVPSLRKKKLYKSTELSDNISRVYIRPYR